MSSDTSINKTSPQRNFRPSWKNEYSWLEYDAQNNLMFCTLCRAYNKKNTFGTNGKVSAIKDHMKTRDHSKSYKQNKITNVPPEHIISLMKIVYCMAKDDLPLNKFKHLTHLGQLLYSISSSIENNIWRELSLASAIGIIVDESTDIAMESHIIIYVRYFINGIIKIRFLSLLEIKAKDAKSIYNTIIKQFIVKTKNYLNINNNYLKLSTNLNKFFISMPPKKNTKISSHLLIWTLDQESNLMMDITSFTSILILEIQKQFQCNPFINAMKIFRLSDKLLNSQNILEFGNEELELLLDFYNKSQLPLFLLAIVNPNDTCKNECEHGFSKQNLIKTKLRNAINPDTLHMLMMIGLEETDITEFNFNDALNIWYRSKKRRIK
ncbi:7160_t:CDS:2 [Cetraspora pellucida]|uniref:7160_t:CDS:1 n=1 Tax=Cetraspora pellucida TaxID=1433469 RepID=A0A9N9H807_9GLOM|nr:7160_t:CDS:2 [Cetraspora pellucida]